MSLRAVIFDLDGTVVENSYDWPGIRAELGTTASSILEYLDGLPEPERSGKWAILERHEAEQTRQSSLREGMRELLGFLRDEGVKTALVTNNTKANTSYLLSKFRLTFDHVITRESGLWKPTGAPFADVMRVFGVKPGECAVVGDTRFDVWAATDAGIDLILILTNRPEDFEELPAETFPGIPELEERLAKEFLGEDEEGPEEFD
jgi:HAD superfamily hydrolase (TIGR01509 family)